MRFYDIKLKALVKILGLIADERNIIKGYKASLRSKAKRKKPFTKNDRTPANIKSDLVIIQLALRDNLKKVETLKSVIKRHQKTFPQYHI